jgi:hypothetical protein
MLATTGFENQHAVRIYDTTIVGNATDIKLAEEKNDPKEFPVPDPKMVEKIYIEAKVPQTKSGYNGVITETLKKNFPKTWAAFEAGKEKADDRGTPIDAIPEMNASIKARLIALGYETLEDLAEVDDNVVTKLPFGNKMREKARLVLKSMDGDKLDNAIDELQEMRDIIAEQAEQIKALSAKNTKSKKTTKTS